MSPQASKVLPAGWSGCSEVTASQPCTGGLKQFIRHKLSMLNSLDEYAVHADKHIPDAAQEVMQPQVL